MAVSYHVDARRGLVHARFQGFVSTAETLGAAQACAQHPDFSPLFNQVIDFAEVEGFERDYARLIAMLAELPDHLLQPGTEPIIVYVAPTPVGQEMARVVLKSMTGLPGPVFRVVSTLAEALALLGWREEA